MRVISLTTLAVARSLIMTTRRSMSFAESLGLLQTLITTGISSTGNMSVFSRVNANAPNTVSSKAITATESGRRRAKLTIHIEEMLQKKLGLPAKAFTVKRQAERFLLAPTNLP